MTRFLAESTAQTLEALAAADTFGADPLTRVRLIRELVAALESDQATLAAVREAQAGGATWDAIAEAAGLSVTAAKWRWQGSDAEIAERHEAGRKRAARPSAKPTDLPGLSVAEAAAQSGVSVQAIYLQVKRGTLRAETVTLDDGRSYKRVFPE